MSTRTTVVLNARPSARAREIPVDFVVEATTARVERNDFAPREASPSVHPWPAAWPVLPQTETEPPAHVWGLRIAGWLTMLAAVVSIILAYVFCDGAETMQLVVAEAASGAFVVGAILAWPRAS